MKSVRDDFLVLVGKTKRKDEETTLSNQEQLSHIKDIVADYFGNRALYVFNQENITREFAPYPEYYIAGWFVSEDPVKLGSGSELVVLTHGHSMELAKKSLMSVVANVDWDLHALDF